MAPVFDDAEAAARLLGELHRVFAGTGVELSVLFVDDGSPVSLTEQLALPAGLRCEVLRLRRNVGHQRAIALGVAYAEEHVQCDALLIMDADGEDRPADALALVARCRALEGRRIVFAERTRRSESALFQGFYRIYQLLHWLLTGVRVRVGNFSVVPAARLRALVTLPALWNHYAAAIFQSRLPREQVPTVRDRRYSGRSKMNFPALVIHGLQAISVFIDVVAVRLLFTVSVLTAGTGGLLALALAAVGLGVAWLPVWLPFAAGGFFVTSACLALGCFSLVLGFLAQRNRLDFIPARDYRLFVEELQQVPKAVSPASHRVSLAPARGMEPASARSDLQP